MTVMVCVAHPDDEVLMCGGTIRRHREAGDRVVVLTITDGVTSRKFGMPAEQSQAVLTRITEFHAAMAALGVERDAYVNLQAVTGGYPDQMLDTVPLSHLAQRINEFIDHDQPAVVYTHHPHDLNQDHRAVCQAVLIATRPFQSPVGRVLGGEVLETTWAAFGEPTFAPNVFMGLTSEDVRKKLEALACYRSEARERPHPRHASRVDSLAAVRGGQIGAEYAEAFVLLREVQR